MTVGVAEAKKRQTAKILGEEVFQETEISCRRNLLLRYILKLPRIKTGIVLRECETGAKTMKREWDDGSDEG